ncbi:uv radiation resistance-associated protein [Nannochloropsis gaditana]|uniref:Uv radiation resistance-associated protein n=1 Tax=Nannochloropsis gaditana TaxID=72520 RepID=W7TRZ7_9STRA|nr:uv radiation resistance-associated protein [Nannochloropsis gaditana]
MEAEEIAVTSTSRKEGRMLFRLLRQLRSISIRNLGISTDDVNSAPPPSTYIQVLAPPPPSSSPPSSSPPLTPLVAPQADFRVHYTSQVAPSTYNPTWLVLDLEPFAEHTDEEGKNKEGGCRPPSEAHGEEFCVRVFRAPGPYDEGVNVDRETLSDHFRERQNGKWRGWWPCQPATGESPLAEFVFRLPDVWCLPPSMKLAHLHLPCRHPSCLLATGEDGKGLLVSASVGVGLGLEGGGTDPAPYLLDEPYLAGLEELQHRPSFSPGFPSARASSVAGHGLPEGLASRDLAPEGRGPKDAPSPVPVWLRTEARRLEALLEAEEGALAVEEEALVEEEEDLRGLVAMVEAEMGFGERLAGATRRLLGEERAREESLLRKEFLVARRQQRLVAGLRRIYPIEQGAGEQEYRIRGLELPADVVHAPKDDEVVASALGYVCHVLVMLSKYLEVPLRYALEPRASRSLIRDATVGYPVFPLYRRGVERERFEWAIYLLRKDIQGLLHARGVPTALLPGRKGVGGTGGQWGFLPDPPQGAHILQNLEALFTHELSQSFAFL